MNAQIRPQSAERQELCNALRFLAIDAVEAANSGHPGMPLGMAEIAEVLWREHLKHNPADPLWPDRDRFVLSNGHGSMLHNSWMSRPNNIVVPGGQMGLAMQFIFTPMILRLIDLKRRA